MCVCVCVYVRARACVRVRACVCVFRVRALGSHSDIQHAGVQYILENVISELQVDPKRRFIYVEIAFFARWWQRQTDAKKAIVRRLVENRQFEFINGGASMNDEGATHYTDTIDQMTWGHQFLLHEFGADAVPTIGWQIDPFGHSAEQASLFALMGFNAMFFGRVDFQDFQHRRRNKTLEYVWRGSPSLGTATQLFTGIFFASDTNVYGPPPGFNFDQNCWGGPCPDAPLQDDPSVPEYNIEERAAAFVQLARQQALHYRGNDILMTMGSDFMYENAASWFMNLDKLIAHVNGHPAKYGVNVFYSTPSTYVAAKHASNLTWSVKTDDHFPYCMFPHGCLTGTDCVVMFAVFVS
jgi:lysosomal alpha-mannosidase